MWEAMWEQHRPSTVCPVWFKNEHFSFFLLPHPLYVPPLIYISTHPTPHLFFAFFFRCDLVYDTYIYISIKDLFIGVNYFLAI